MTLPVRLPILSLAVALSAEPARAAEPDPSVWAAVGRITFGTPDPTPGSAVCTGTLVAPDTVLTAAHCLPAALPRRFQFAAGFDGTTARARRYGRAVVLAPSGRGAPGSGDDVALLLLDRPITPEEAVPLPLGAAVDADQPFRFLGYSTALASDGAPAGSALCVPLGEAGRVLRLSCPAVSGNSGAPVLGTVGGRWHVLGVMSSVIDSGLIQSLASVPPPGFVAATGG